jgi:hypothetical protein
MASFSKSSRGEIRHVSDQQKLDARRLQDLTVDLASREDIDWQHNSHLTMHRRGLSRILYYDNIYRNLVGVPGVILEFGVQWGATLSLLTNLRGLHEPFNFTRKIIGFDTFEGFPSLDVLDGAAPAVGDYAVPEGHAARLGEILRLHEASAPIAHIHKHELVIGDVVKTLPQWLEENPHVVIGMAIFDVDLYEPTKEALELVIPRLTKGSILVFDELNHEEFPGETLALKDVLGLDKLRLHQLPHQPRCAWGVWGD